MKKMNFEDYINKLKEITQKLENEEESLENSVKLYEEGKAAAKACKEMLEKAKQKITIIENE